MTSTIIETLSQTADSHLLHLRPARPAVNHHRMNDTLQFSCQWGATDDGGMNRLTLNDDDAKVRRWFISQVEELGCTVTIDAIGNIFAVMPGKIEGPPIAMGSHLDTQPTGGRYDGILGVLAGLEVLRAVKESGYKTHHPLAVVCWTNEEGARFVPAMLGSGVWAEHHMLEYGYTRTDEQGVDLKAELDRHNFIGATPASYKHIPLLAHFEIHIEQGPILDHSGCPVAVVAGVQALRWFEVKLCGRGSHAGTTPMAYRVDPLGAFAAFILAAEEVALENGGLATVGRVSSDAPMSTNCIIDNIVFHVDIRHHEDEKISAMEEALRQRLDAIVGQKQGVKVERFEVIADNKYVRFDADAVQCVKDACAQWAHPPIISGAGHDSVHTAKRCPSAMIFIRCKDGISHHPSEYSSPDDITAGTKVLLESVLAYDTKSAART